MAIYTTYQEQARNDSVAVGTSSVVLCLPRNQDNPRKVISVRNTSPNAADIIYINFGLTQATANTGIVLKQNEGFTDSQDGTAYYPFQGSITAICATANGTVSILER